MSDLLYSTSNTSHSFICGDVQETLKSFNDDTFDLVIADPPYNIIINQETKLPGNHGLETMGGAWKIFDEHWDKLDFSSYLKFTLDYLAEVKRVVKPSGSIWI